MVYSVTKQGSFLEKGNRAQVAFYQVIDGEIEINAQVKVAFLTVSGR